MASWWGGGGGAGKDEIKALKDEVSRLQREREQLHVKCTAFEQQLEGAAQRRVTPSAGASAEQDPLKKDLASFIDTAAIAIFGIDRIGNVIKWNTRVEELMGKKAESVIGRTLSEVLSESHETPAETRKEVEKVHPCCWS
jgi:PAS domain-containing protein